MSEKQQLDDPPAYTPNIQTKLPRPPPLELPCLLSLRPKRVILASASPRRRQLLAQIGLHPEVIPSNFAEDIPKTSLTPYEYVLATATEKALAVYRQVIDEEKGEVGVIIAADTVVVDAKGDILEKPRSEREHFAMLKALRDRGASRVYTAVACVAPLESARDPGYVLESGWEETIVKFDPEMSDDFLMAYIRTREGVDKAGGYGIQGTGAILVERIEGSFDNVVGLPLRKTLKVIEKVVFRSQDEDMLNGEVLEEMAEEAEPE